MNKLPENMTTSEIAAELKRLRQEAEEAMLTMWLLLDCKDKDSPNERAVTEERRKRLEQIIKEFCSIDGNGTGRET